MRWLAATDSDVRNMEQVILEVLKNGEKRRSFSLTPSR